MVQSVKIIDVDSTFVPVDPNAFPATMHGTQREDSPEKEPPVAAYEGYNFLPTPYGYKSYFGTTGELGVDALDPGTDKVFIIQTNEYENILVALTKNGIWTKRGNVSGAWTQEVSLAVPDEGTHLQWTYTIIGGEVYLYRATSDSYYTMKESDSFAVVAATPTFLNMAGQQGIFRAGGRLGFWDSENSLSWSSLDDFTDFVPSIETLAGSAIFVDVNGRVVTVLPHGAGFIIYATKSVVYIRQAVDTTFQWAPLVVVSGAGIAYPEEATSAVTDTIHYASASNGVYQIENGVAKIIVPEVTDYLRESADPLFLRILEGRYLAIQLLDPHYVDGQVQFTTSIVPALTYYFPGTDLDSLEDANVVDGNGTCSFITQLNTGYFQELQADAQTAFDAADDPVPMLDGGLFTPIWEYSFSYAGSLDPESITFGDSPCATLDPYGVDADMCPVQDLPEVPPAANGIVQEADGDHFTIFGFMQTQKALWDFEAASRRKVVAKVLARTASVTKVTEDLASCSIAGPTTTECTMARIIKDSADITFEYTRCAVYASRTIISANDLVRVKTVQTGCDGPNDAFAVDNRWQGIDASDAVDRTVYGADPVALAATVFSNYLVNSAQSNPERFSYQLSSPVSTGGGTTILSVGYTLNLFYDDPVSGVIDLGVSAGVVENYYTCAVGTIAFGDADDGHPPCSLPTYTKTETMTAYNRADPVDIDPVIDTAFCRITEWEYIDENGDTQRIPASVCPTDIATVVIPNPVADDDGTACGIPYDPSIIEWPSTEVTLPASSFLLQDGSIGPIYPTFYGALVYDLQLKKWGKMKLQYKQLLDYSPVNNSSGDPVHYETFGVKAGALKADGHLYLFDSYPDDSYIKYGKIGYYRAGRTAAEAVRVDFRSKSTGTLEIETSLDGRSLEVVLGSSTSFTNAVTVTAPSSSDGSWHNVAVRGIYDIQYMEYRGHSTSRR